MSRYLSLFLCVFLLSVLASGQSNNERFTDALDVKTAGVLGPGQQARVWQNISNADQTNADAWLNRFIWEQRSGKGGQPELQQTLGQAAQHIKGSYQYALMEFLLSDKTDEAALKRAEALCTDKTLLYPYQVQYCIQTGNTAAMAAYAQQLNAARPLAEDSAAFYYHLNVLASADSNAVIYARGQNDLVPLAQLQQAYGYRKDIRLSYYRDNAIMDATRPSYLCLSLGAGVLKRYTARGCYTGLLMRVSGSDTAELLKHYPHFNLDYLQRMATDATSSAMGQNYLPALIQLYRYYAPLDPAKATTLRDLILRIAGKGHSVTKVMGLLTDIEKEH